jgi:hypothetical protein
MMGSFGTSPKFRSCLCEWGETSRPTSSGLPRKSYSFARDGCSFEPPMLAPLNSFRLRESSLHYRHFDTKLHQAQGPLDNVLNYRSPGWRQTVQQKLVTSVFTFEEGRLANSEIFPGGKNLLILCFRVQEA